MRYVTGEELECFLKVNFIFHKREKIEETGKKIDIVFNVLKHNQDTLAIMENKILKEKESLEMSIIFNEELSKNMNIFQLKLTSLHNQRLKLHESCRRLKSLLAR